MVVKTFRGLLASGGQDRIRLSTIKGKVGYKITKFQVMSKDPGTDTVEGVVKIFKSEQTTINGTINFTDTELLAVCEYHSEASATNPVTTNIIFDTEMFNQDIYVTSNDAATTALVDLNYYIELEVIPLDDKGAEYTTVKDLRTRGF